MYEFVVWFLSAGLGVFFQALAFPVPKPPLFQKCMKILANMKLGRLFVGKKKSNSV